MTTRSTSNKATERELTKGELQRIEERRHVETVIRGARRVRFPRRKTTSTSQGEPLKVQRTTPSKEPPRLLTPAEQERIAERRHVEAVMKNARRSRLRFQRKPRPAPADRGAATGGAEVQAGSPTPRHGISPLVAAFGVAVLALACALLGLTIRTAVQNSRLVKDLASVRQQASALTERQQSSTDKVEQVLDQVTRVEAGLVAVKNSQEALESTVGALEAARASDAAQWQERLSGIETATREGLTEVTSHLDREDALAASVDRLLPLLQPSGATAPEQTESETSNTP